uniref:Small nuclear ribonucleoprotein E n=1 Tax=Rhabditophanes sp. KR3021 TaxID=114890 RepID=A0AC35U197_9BILA
MAPQTKKATVLPISIIFRFMQSRKKVSIWLYEDVTHRIEGYILGFDEYMNIVIDDAVERNLKTNVDSPIGRIMLKGDNITVIQDAEGV